MNDAICSVDACQASARSRGWCEAHYNRWLRHGDPTAGQVRGDHPRRFFGYVEKTETCWLWTAATVRGYGYFRLGDRMVKAHRFAYELLVGPIPEGLTIDHLCRVRNCVNPAHLEPVTAEENTRRAAASGNAA